MSWLSVLRHQLGMLFILFTVTSFPPLAFGQAEVKAIEAPPFTLNDLEGEPTSLKDFYAEAEAVVVFFVKVNSTTVANGRDLARHLENEYKGNWKGIPAKVLIVAHGDANAIKQPLLFSVELKFQTDLDNGNISETLQKFRDNKVELSDSISIEKKGSKWIIQDKDSKRKYFVKEENGKLNIYKQPKDDEQATDEIHLPILQGTDAVFKAYGVVVAYELYVICVERASDGVIIARFSTPADIRSEKVDIAVKSCVLEDYIIKASFDDERRVSVFKRSDGFLLTGSDISPVGEITYGFSNKKRVGNQGFSVEISFTAKGEGSFGIKLADADLSQAAYLSMWILGDVGMEQLYTAIEGGNDEGNQLLVSDYISVQRNRWQRVSIPLTDFNLDLREVSSVSLRFDPRLGKAIIYVDDIGFYKEELAKISGTIKYRENGNPVDGAIVITDPKNVTVTSDASGQYGIASIRFGTYTIAVVKDGKTVFVSVVTLERGQDRKFDIQIQIDEISICITEAPPAGKYPKKGIIKGAVLGVGEIDIERYKVVIYSKIKDDRFYIQPWEADPYTSIRSDGYSKWEATIHLGDESYAALLVQIREPLSSIESSFQSELAMLAKNKDRRMSKNLRREFEDNGIFPTESAFVLSPPNKQDSRWLIAHGDPEAPTPEYLIRKEGGELNVYDVWPLRAKKLPADADVDAAKIIDADRVSPGFKLENPN